jgi:hypothetical protein
MKGKRRRGKSGTEVQGTFVRETSDHTLLFFGYIAMHLTIVRRYSICVKSLPFSVILKGNKSTGKIGNKST